MNEVLVRSEDWMFLTLDHEKCDLADLCGKVRMNSAKAVVLLRINGYPTSKS